MIPGEKEYLFEMGSLREDLIRGFYRGEGGNGQGVYILCEIFGTMANIYLSGGTPSMVSFTCKPDELSQVQENLEKVLGELNELKVAS